MYNQKFGLYFYLLFSKVKFEKHFAGLIEDDHINKIIWIFITFQNILQPEKVYRYTFA